MDRIITGRRLQLETVAYEGTAGVSACGRSHGFAPAFQDTRTHAVYLSCFGDGRPAPCHLLDGLPDDVVLTRDEFGRVAALQPGVISGFVRDGEFFTREEAARDALDLH